MSSDSPLITPPLARMAPPLRMSYEEFLAWAPESQLAEWVDGEAFIMAPPSIRHQDVLAFLSDLLRWFVSARSLGKVLFAPVQMKLQYSGREPDILFLSKEHAGRLTELYLDGPADLVVEVVSPEGRTRDRVEKFREYQQAGVREYWVVDPMRRQAEFYALGADGVYTLLAEEAGVVRSRVLTGFWLKPAWLWQAELPALQDVLKEWEAAMT